MDNAMPTNCNVIYSPVFLLCWGKVRDTLGGTINANDEYIYTINRQTSYKGALAAGEYKYGITMMSDYLRIVTKFKKELHFEAHFQKQQLSFEGTRVNPVSAFGIDKYEPELARQVRILYYKDDDHFVIKLIATENEEELILAKGMNNAGSLAAIGKKIDSLVAKGEEERIIPIRESDYRFYEGDKLKVPILKFNLEKSFDRLVGKYIGPWRIDTARQQTAFLLNEEGAKAEAEAEIVMTLSIPMQPVPTKRLVFDKPFTVILRKNGQKHPYLMVKVENPELMVK